MDEQTDTDSGTKDRLVSQLQRLNLQIEVLQAEVTQLRLFGAQARKRRKDEVGQLRLSLTGKSGILWLKMQKMRRFGNLTECKNALTYQRNPEHDTSPKTLTAEAKLLLAQRQGAIIDRQSEIIQKFQKDTIEYLYTTVLPNIKDEQRMATAIGQMQIDKHVTEQQTVIRLFEECLGLRRAIVLKYKLRDLANVYSRPPPPADLSVGNNATPSVGTRPVPPRRMGQRGVSASSLGNLSSTPRRVRRISASSHEPSTSKTTSNGTPTTTSSQSTKLSTSPRTRRGDKSDLLERARSARVLIMEKSKLRDNAKSHGRSSVSPGILNEGNDSMSSIGVHAVSPRRQGQGDDSVASGEQSTPSVCAGHTSERDTEPTSSKHDNTDNKSATLRPHVLQSTTSSHTSLGAEARADFVERGKVPRSHAGPDTSGRGPSRSSTRLSKGGQLLSATTHENGGRVHRGVDDSTSSMQNASTEFPAGRPRQSLLVSESPVATVPTKSPGGRRTFNGLDDRSTRPGGAMDQQGRLEPLSTRRRIEAMSDSSSSDRRQIQVLSPERRAALRKGLRPPSEGSIGNMSKERLDKGP